MAGTSAAAAGHHHHHHHHLPHLPPPHLHHHHHPHALIFIRVGYAVTPVQQHASLGSCGAPPAAAAAAMLNPGQRQLPLYITARVRLQDQLSSPAQVQAAAAATVKSAPSSALSSTTAAGYWAG